MPKKKILRLIFILLVVSLIIPVYYVVNLASTAIILRNISNHVKVNRPRIEYFTFINLESVIKYKFNSSNYLIYAFANHTKGSSELVRDIHKNLVIENTNIYHVHGTIQNRETKDIYRFESAYLNISEANTLVKMYKDFYITLELTGKSEVVEMRGDHLIFNLSENSIKSENSVIFNAGNALLVGGDFYFKDNKVIMKGDIFVDSDMILASADVLEVYFSQDSSMIHKQQLVFEKAIFSGHGKLFDKTNNTHISADTITIDNQKKITTLHGNAVIRRTDGTIKGDKMFYNLSRGFAKVTGKKNERVQLKIQY